MFHFLISVGEKKKRGVDVDQRILIKDAVIRPASEECLH